jgi:uncharacterized protein (TIGR02453 family)
LNLPRLSTFLAELKFNNSKVWLDANRERYTELRLDFVTFMEQVVAGVAAFDPSVAKVQARDTLFRINRDVRFAHDKSPYKSTFSAAISSAGKKATWPLYYVQFGPDEAYVASGVYAPEPAELRRIRLYTEKYPDQAEALLADRGLKRHFGGLSEDSRLTRFPRGFGSGSELLRYRSFTVGSSFDAEPITDLSAHVSAKFKQTRPLHAWLREALAFREE